MILFIIFLIFAALFAAFDQVIRYPERFLPISRLHRSWYEWDSGYRIPFPLNAPKTYQGLKVWSMALSWYLVPEMHLWQFTVIMIAWYAILRNFMLHTVLTRDKRIL